MTEELLTGGFTNAVVRVGDTVRRTAGPWTATVQRLLAHVRARGIDWVPEPRGCDERGREVLSYVEGVVPHEMPEWVWSESVLIDVGRALRAWHDASESFDRDAAVWHDQRCPAGEVTCHNDFAPYNLVFRDARFAGAIDFDTCSPGSRLWDLAYTAYRFVPLMPPRSANVDDGAQERSPFPPEAARHRLDAFVDAYAVGNAALRFSDATLRDTVAQRLIALAEWTERHARATAQSALAGHARMYRAHATWLGASTRGMP